MRLDRLQLVTPRFGNSPNRTVPAVPGFKIQWDIFVRRQARIKTYSRVRFLLNQQSGTKLFIQYSRAHGWLKPIRVTMVGADSTGILWPDLRTIGEAFGESQVRMVEIAFDFDPASGVDYEYVLKHALFGKSRPAHNPAYPGVLRYGARDSDKMVRCYWKEPVKAFRVELELHAKYLSLSDTVYLLYALGVGDGDFRFVKVDWKALRAHLKSKGTSGRRIAAQLQANYTSIHNLLRYLRASGVHNPHRFLLPSKKHSLIEPALDAWCESLRPGVRNRSVEDEKDE